MKKNTEKNPDKTEGKYQERYNKGEVFSGAGKEFFLAFVATQGKWAQDVGTLGFGLLSC